MRGAAALAACIALFSACEREGEQAVSSDRSPPAPGPASTPAVAARPSPATPTPEVARLSADGFGPVRIGMSEAEAARLLGPGVKGVTGAADDCHQLSLEPQPAPLLFMIESGRVARVTARAGHSGRTDRGLGVGATAAQVRETYGSTLVVEPHKYVPPPAEYLTAWSIPGQRGISYVVGQDGRVEEIHAGGPAIQYVEGCA